jgi:4-amino-4-deoxy-L-arabinose transferase-like glycosyltransferase
LAPLVDRGALVGEPGRPGRVAGVGRGLAVAALVALPWHVYAVARYGWPFIDSYLIANVLRRSTGAMLQTTRWSFYLRELWRSEGWLAVVVALSVGWVLLDALRRRRPADLLVASWALGVMAVYSVARSRYDHYLLLAYPAFALAVGLVVGDKLPVRPGVRALAAATLIATAAVTHWPRNLGSFAGEDETRALVELVNPRLPPAARIYAYNTHAYAARFYATHDVTTLLESADDLRLAAELRRAGLPSSVAPAADLPLALAALPRPFALLMPRARVSLVAGTPLRALAESRHYVLLVAD